MLVPEGVSILALFILDDKKSMTFLNEKDQMFILYVSPHLLLILRRLSYWRQTALAKLKSQEFSSILVLDFYINVTLEVLNMEGWYNN